MSNCTSAIILLESESKLLLSVCTFTSELYNNYDIPYVTGFRKTDHIVTIDIARNTDLKY